MARAPAQPQERSRTETSPWIDPVELSTHCKSAHALVALGQQRASKKSGDCLRRSRQCLFLAKESRERNQ
jgi:hypothetical protein